MDEASQSLPLGEKDTCKDCGEPIEWISPYWRHVGSTPRHMATPTLWKPVKQEGPMWRKAGS